MNSQQSEVEKARQEVEFLISDKDDAILFTRKMDALIAAVRAESAAEIAALKARAEKAEAGSLEERGSLLYDLYEKNTLCAELLEALEHVVEAWTSQFERNGHLAPAWCKKARAAIDKAKGASQ